MTAANNFQSQDKTALRTERVLKGLPELYQMDRWAEEAPSSGLYRANILNEVQCGQDSLPIYSFEVGSQDHTKPTVIFTGGVHGIERIGTQILLSYMHTLFHQLDWDETLNDMLKELRVLFVPLVNPGGMLLKRRANPNGVDLMRNAPVDAQGKVSFMLGGHRVSKRLPWYRGRKGTQMELESHTLTELINDLSHNAEFLTSVDCHSGFGRIDRVWFPYACTPDPFENIGEMFALRQLFRRTHPNFSFYRIEPQSHQYTTHGDIWDHLYLSTKEQRKGVYLPLTLEMGSWMWVKKNPRQLFNSLGMFNPVMPHRLERVLRRHQTFFEFILRSARAHREWMPPEADKRDWMHRAINHWY